MRYIHLIFIASLMLLASPAVSLQVLGSGGPELGDKRASTSYLIWIDGKSRILVDFGGGASLRFEEVGADIKELNLILLTHLHVDHTADLPTLLKASFFTQAAGQIDIFGPSSNDIMPDTQDFIKRLFASTTGAWHYLGDHLDGRAKLQITAHNIPKSRNVHTIYQDRHIKVSTVTVHHGPIPAQAYRIDIGSKSITFSGDMNGAYHTLEKLAQDTDILVMHNAIAKRTKGIAARLHMTPVTIGEIAYKARAKSLVISHRMLRTLGREKQTNCEIRRHYEGDIHYANDKDIYPLQ